MNPWSHLPIADSIDRIRQLKLPNGFPSCPDLIINPLVYPDIHGSDFTSEYRQLWYDVMNGAYETNNIVAGACSGECVYTIRGSLYALLVYDDCARLLDEDPEAVLTMAILGCKKSMIMYPATAALKRLGE